MKRGYHILMLNLAMMVVLVKKSEGVWLSFPGAGAKCVSEEIHKNVIVLVDYVVDDPQLSNPTVSIKVTLYKQHLRYS